MVVVEAALASHEALDQFEPRRMVDQVLKGLPGFIDLLQIQAGRVVSVGMGVDIAEPLPRHEGRNPVQAGVEFSDFIVGERVLEMQITSKVKQISIQFGIHERPWEILRNQCRNATAAQESNVSGA